MRVTVSLIAHTNIGKTTLARTLLRKDVGEVRDAPHVTEVSEAHVWLQAPDGTKLLLWDTPGFGDTARLLKRLKAQPSPIQWMLTQVWDRFSNRPLWCSQQAIKNINQDADLVLYLVNASEHPTDASYLQMELEILAWLDKPVMVVLNQTGRPRSTEERNADLTAWRAHLGTFHVVKNVIDLDAFARCWLQECGLLMAIGKLLGTEQQEAINRLITAWTMAHRRSFEESMQALSRPLAKAAADREPIPGVAFARMAAGWGASLGEATPHALAQAALMKRYDASVRTAIEAVITANGIRGKAAVEASEQMSNAFQQRQAVNKGWAAFFAAIVSGAGSGLAADLAAGGLTFGGGALIGALSGAFVGSGGANLWNRLRGVYQSDVRWSEPALRGFARIAVLRYLTIAHFGRGQGEYKSSAEPEHWQRLVEGELARSEGALARSFELARSGAAIDVIEKAITDCLARMVSAVLCELYPDINTEAILDRGSGPD